MESRSISLSSCSRTLLLRSLPEGERVLGRGVQCHTAYITAQVTAVPPAAIVAPAATVLSQCDTVVAIIYSTRSWVVGAHERVWTNACLAERERVRAERLCARCERSAVCRYVRTVRYSRICGGYRCFRVSLSFDRSVCLCRPECLFVPGLRFGESVGVGALPGIPRVG